MKDLIIIFFFQFLLHHTIHLIQFIGKKTLIYHFFKFHIFVSEYAKNR